MINVVHAELIKLTRTRALLAAALLACLFAGIASTVVFLTASDDPSTGGRTATVASLSSSDGLSQAFSLGASFFGFLAFVTFIALIAGEFSQGTFRTLLLRQPQRVRLLAGKMVGLVLFVAAVVALGILLTTAFSFILAPVQDIPTGEWLTLAGARNVLVDYMTVLVGLAAWSVYAMALAVNVRSLPIALGAGIAWAGPFEHLTQEAWTTLQGWYPGLLLEALAAGGTDAVSYERALGMTAVYAAIAACIGLLSFTRRDMVG